MATLLLRLAGPLQSWGASSKFNMRMTEREPTKSGVIGMIASAMGRPRDSSISDLTALHFGVRIDQGGELLRDYHTAHHPTDKDAAFTTNRFYLADAIFLVGLEGDEQLLNEIDASIKAPFFPLYLGRRSCPPSGRISLGVTNRSLLDALRDEPWLASEWYMKKQESELHLEIVYDSESDKILGYKRDVPVSFGQEHRMHTFRSVEYNLEGGKITNPQGRLFKKETISEHDAMAEIKSQRKP